MHESDPDVDWNECVEFRSVISRGTALGPGVALKGVECARLRQIRAVTSLQGPGYTREQLVEFQKSDCNTFMKLLFQLWGIIY